MGAMLTKEQLYRECGYGTCFQYVPAAYLAKAIQENFAFTTALSLRGIQICVTIEEALQTRWITNSSTPLHLTDGRKITGGGIKMAHENERKNMDQRSNDLAAVQNHQPGRLDFQIVKKDVSVTEFRRKPSAVWRFLETTGHVVFFTRRGKRECAIMSIETHACLSGDYEKTMNEVEEAAAAWRAEQKIRRKERRRESQHAGSRELPPEKHAAPEEDNSISFNPQTDPLPGSGNT